MPTPTFSSICASRTVSDFLPRFVLFLRHQLREDQHLFDWINWSPNSARVPCFIHSPFKLTGQEDTTGSGWLSNCATQPNPPQLSDCAGVIRRQLPPALRHFAQTCSAPPTQYNTNLRYVTIFTTFLHITDECSFEGEPDGRQLTSSGFHRPGPAPPRNCYFFTSSSFSLDFNSQYE